MMKKCILAGLVFIASSSTNAMAAESLTDVGVMDIDVRTSLGYALIRMDKSFTSCSEGNFVKLPLADGFATKAAFSTFLSAKATGSKVDVLSSDTCSHFNVVDRVKIK